MTGEPRNKMTHEVDHFCVDEGEPGSEASNAVAPRKCEIRVPRITTVSHRVDHDELSFRQYDPGDPAAIRETVEDVTVPPELRSIMDAYYAHLDDRSPYQWKWLFWAFQEYQLSCVDDAHRERLAVVKTGLGVFNALLDDVAEDENDRETFWELAKCVHPEVDPDWERPDIDPRYAAAARAMWTRITDLLEVAPRYGEFRDLWLFDVRNAITGMDYSELSTRYDALVNDVESWLYDTQNVMTVGLTMMDLMYSPSFDRTDLRPLRQILYLAQEMWRIGNWLMTWRRELVEGDHSAAVVITALREGIVTEDELDAIEAGTTDPEEAIERIESADIEESLLAEWERRRDAILDRRSELGTVDVEAFVRASERVVSTQLASHGMTK